MTAKLNIPANTAIGATLLVLLLVPGLYFAKPILLPIVLSTFISLLCSPFINYLEDKGLPRAITVVVTLSFLVGASIIGLAAMSEPAKQWWSELPSIVKNVSQEVSEVTQASADHLNTPLNIASDMGMDEVGNNTVFSLVKTLATTTPTILNASGGTSGTVAAGASAADHRHQVQIGAPLNISNGSSNSVGSSDALSRADHIHAPLRKEFKQALLDCLSLQVPE